MITRAQTLPDVFDETPWSGFRKDLNRFLGNEKRKPWAPTIDFFDAGERLVLQAELPGVRKKDVAILVDDGTLAIRGERRRARARDNVAAEFNRERRPGSFHRLVALPVPVEEKKIDARLEDGLLTVNLPKTKPRKENNH